MNASARTLLILLIGLSSICVADDGELSWNEAQSDYQDKKWKEAADKFESLSKREIDHPGIQYNLGCAYFRLKKYEAARGAFEKARKLNPSKKLTLKLLFNLGCANFAESEILLKSKPIKSLERLKSAIVNFRQAIAIDSKDLDAIHNLEWSLKTYQKAWKESQKAREEKKAEDERKKQAKDLEDLKKEQEKLSKENQSEKNGLEQEKQAKEKQEKLSQKTKNQLKKMQKQADPKNEGAKESLERAQRAQKEAEKALKKGDKKTAAQKQREASDALADAANKLRDANAKQKPGEAKEDESMAKEAKDALQQEKANKKRRAQLLRQLNHRGLKPVEKDW
ncbi:MAG: DUF4175 family protein [Planctomycetota bacterium]|nr:DUF4175 family protein [Planctomycetota bacterium]